MLAGIVVGLLAVLDAGGATAASATHSYPAGSRTLVLTRLVRVYTTRGTRYRALDACLLKSGRARRLDYTRPGNDAASGGWFAPPAIDVHGTLVGWADLINGDASGQTMYVTIDDLARRGDPFVVSEDASVAVGSLRVISKHAFAWIACNSVANGPLNSQQGCAPPAHHVFNAVEVYDAGSTDGIPTEVDQGARVGARSLRRRGNTVTWRNGSARRSATLTP